MKYVQLNIHLTDDLGLKGIMITENTTDLPSDSEFLSLIASAILRSIEMNKPSLYVQDTLNELGIDRELTLNKKQ